jgi:hypothetical protein
MTYRNLALGLLMLTWGAAAGFAEPGFGKKEPKYEAAHPLTPEQSAWSTRPSRRKRS